ncbi:hypothetical protein SRABI106_02296 [Rahnella aquatilis]|nr:hypothetical protein SRABI106_02296 [Rahnella aquatilis]
MERCNQQAPRFFATEGLCNTLFHFTRGFIGKGDSRNVTCLIATFTDQVCDFIGNYTGFTGASPRQNQAGSGDEFDGVLLAGV